MHTGCIYKCTLLGSWLFSFTVKYHYLYVHPKCTCRQWPGLVVAWGCYSVEAACWLAPHCSTLIPKPGPPQHTELKAHWDCSTLARSTTAHMGTHVNAVSKGNKHQCELCQSFLLHSNCICRCTHCKKAGRQCNGWVKEAMTGKGLNLKVEIKYEWGK